MKFLIANWKMNKSFIDGYKLVKQICRKVKNQNRKKIIILPPIQSTLHIKTKITDNNVIYGSQNCSHFKNGAYTGEISAEMIKKIGCRYVLIGHSERRSLFNETDLMFTEKIKRALEQKLKVIFCVGESLKHFNNKKSKETIFNQINGVFDKKVNFKNIIIAYEPIWAIGTNKTPELKEIENIASEIKNIVEIKFKSSRVPILYGGSVNSKNASDIFSLKSIDGGLIGGASLIASEFCKIYDSL